jgi:hypothetical protein
MSISSGWPIAKATARAKELAGIRGPIRHEAEFSRGSEGAAGQIGSRSGVNARPRESDLNQ